MTKMIRFILAVSAVLAFSVIGTSAAQASNGISLSENTITANGPLTLSNGLAICDVSLTLQLLNNPIVKDPDPTRVQARVVQPSSIRNCSGGLAIDGAVLTPIDIVYDSFGGTLPNISSIRVDAPNAGFALNTILGTCLFGGNLQNIDFLISSGSVTTARFNNTGIPIVTGPCPSPGTIAGDLTVLAPVPTATLV